MNHYQPSFIIIHHHQTSIETPIDGNLHIWDDHPLILAMRYWEHVVVDLPDQAAGRKGGLLPTKWNLSAANQQYITVCVYIYIY